MSSLEDAVVRDGALVVGNAVFAALYIDVEWLDHGALVNALRLARAGAPVILKRRPAESGHRRHPDYEGLLDSLGSLPNVLPSLRSTAIRPFVAADVLPHYWARRTEEALYVFLAHPETRNVRYPMRHRQSREARSRRLELRFSWGVHERALTVPFVGQSSVLLRLGRDGDVGTIENEPGN
jgi:hypothetical protein